MEFQMNSNSGYSNMSSMRRRQSFALPFFMMNRITQEWTPKVYEKLIKSCKYFFAKSQTLVVESLVIQVGFTETTEGCFLKGKTLDCDFEKEYEIVDEKVDLFNTQVKSLWLTGNIALSGQFFHGYSYLQEHIYCCDVYTLTLKEVPIFLADLEVITKNVKYLKLERSVVVFPDETRASIGDILNASPNVEEFE